MQLDVEREELKGFSRSFGELEWLLLVLVMLYYSVPGTFVADKVALVGVMLVFAVFVLVFRYANFYLEEARWKLFLELWVLALFVICVLWFTGRHESPLVNLYLLVIIFSAVTLGKIHTMFIVCALAVAYIAMAYATVGPSIMSLQAFSRLMTDLAPTVLVAYITTMLSADVQVAKNAIKRLATTDEMTGLFNMQAFSLMLDKEVHKSTRYSETFSLIMFDSDGLKKVNDRYGHDAGDYLI
ncbi:MAG: putative signaling protein [Gammaproteobacteria bacterium]|nr:putative signaling protein [Gammaproteobacteria bacterium]